MMKRLAFLGLLAASTAFLTGCPIWDERGQETLCDFGCGTGGSPTTTTGTGTFGCLEQIDCTGINETCGSDNECHSGDCTIWGCSSGDLCRVGDDMKAHCVEPNGAGGSGGVSTGGTGTGGATTGTGGSGGSGGATTTTGTGGSTTTTTGAGGSGGSSTTTGAGGSSTTTGAGGSTTTGTGGSGTTTTGTGAGSP